MFPQTESNPVGLSATATIPELQQSKTAVLNTLASNTRGGAMNTPSRGLSPGTVASPD